MPNNQELRSAETACPLESPPVAVMEKKPHHWRDTIETPLMSSFGAAMERMSWRGCRVTGAWLGLLFFNGVRRRREIAIGNVRLAFPQLSEAAARQIARRSAQNAAMTLCEFLHSRVASPAEIRQYADIDGIEHIEHGLERGKGVILLTAHLGNWELMGARAAQDFPLTVVARPNSNSGVQRYIDSVRHAAGVGVVSKFDTGRGALGALRANGTLGILPDQHGGAEGLLLPFFGQPTRFVSSVARLAILARAPVVPAFGVRRMPWLADGRIVARVSPGMDLHSNARGAREVRERAVGEGTRLVIAQLEHIIRDVPDQWLWMHRRWRREDGADCSR
jgi:KDO2-lipid IV(A) lauroyltransferase